MADAALWHRLYTQAPEDARWETTGGRFVTLERDATQVLPAEAKNHLDELLRKCMPAGVGIGFIVRRYSASSGELFACVIASYGELVSDVGGRRGVLNHARIVKVAAGEPLLDAAALVQLAESFPLDEVARAPVDERLASYLTFVANERSATLQPLSMLALGETPRTFLSDLLVAWLATHGKKESARFLLPRPEEGSLAHAAAIGWGALPLALQRASSWAVDIEDGCPVDAVLSTSGGQRPAKRAAPQLADVVTRYVNQLLDGPEPFRAILRNSEISSVSRLEQAVRQGGRTEMNKGRGNEPRPSAGGPLDPEITAELDRQYRAMEQSLKAYVDQRMAAVAAADPRARGAALATIDETVQEQPRPRMIAPAAASRVPKAWLIGGVVAALLIAAAVALYFGKPSFLARDGATAPVVRDTRDVDIVPTATQPPPDRRRHEAVRAAVANAEADGKWAESLKNLIEKNGAVVAARMRDAADGVDLDGDVVTTDARDQLSELAPRVERNEALPQKDREEVRRLLLEYAAALVAREQQVEMRVDGKLTDIKPELLARVRSTYSVTSRVADPTNIQLQSEIILRWLEASAR